MKKNKIIFIGASNSYHEISRIIEDCNNDGHNYEVVGLLDDDTRFAGKTVEGIPVLGGLEDARKHSDCNFIFAIGSYKTRLAREAILKKTGLNEDRFITLIHPTAIVYSSARIGAGSIVYPNVTICANAQIGSFCILTFNAVVAPDVTMGDFSMLTTNSIVLTGADVGFSAFIGAGSIIGERVRLGRGSLVVFGSCVYNNVPEGAFVQGNPAKIIRR